jgi:hypothetical protein
MKDAYYKFKMSNGDWWQVPLAVIAMKRAENYAHEYNGDLQASLEDDTLPYFEDDEYNVEDWARNNMNWTDVEIHACRIEEGEIDFQEEWVNPEETRVVWPKETPNDK